VDSDVIVVLPEGTRGYRWAPEPDGHPGGLLQARVQHGRRHLVVEVVGSSWSDAVAKLCDRVAEWRASLEAPDER
jgi:hypothetical protein